MNNSDLEQRLGYRFKNSSLLRLALTHPSFGTPNNQRLEFLGDAVLQLCISEKLYKENPDAPEGKMTRLRALLVQERSLCVAAGRLSISENLILGKGELMTGGKKRASNLADAMEAIIGAVFLDSGFEQAKKLVETMLANIDSSDWRDYKTELQEILQGMGWKMPRYEVVSSSGPAHDVTISSQVFINDEPRGIGSGKSKKDAEQEAARLALETFDNDKK